LSDPVAAILSSRYNSSVPPLNARRGEYIAAAANVTGEREFVIIGSQR
jgi:hypothetical protein